VDTHSAKRRSMIKLGLASGVATSLAGIPLLGHAQTGPIKVGFSTILSGRVAQVGITTKNALVLQFEAFNAAGGLNGRMIQLIDRDSQGKPEEAARIVRELIESQGCEIIICGEGSGASFATHEIGRQQKALMIHAISETSSLSADPKIKSPNIFRTARQALHDSVVGGNFAGKIAKEKGLTRWATISADYAYGREVTPEFLGYTSAAGANVNVVAEAWPKLFQPDYTDVITKILQARPEALFCGLWGGDLVSFVDQANLFGLFDKVKVFSIHMADYTTLTAIKKLPSTDIYSANRYVSVLPATPENQAWSDAYFKRFNSRPTNWSWEADTSARFLIEAIKRTRSADPKKLAEAMRGMEVVSPVGVKAGKILMRSDDQTISHYALGWGRVIPQAPYMVDIQQANWAEITAEDTAWKKKKGYL
jgi:branched-chain amino acid transport system substrate-binding protein